MSAGAWLGAVERIAREAGALILQVYATDFAVSGKADASPVTEADQRAEAHITSALHVLAPGVPVVAEEAASRGEVPALQGRFWLVDPLDGTREFVARNGEFTVNIALIDDGLPTLGVVYVPVTDVLYAGAVGQGAWCEEQGRRRPLAVAPAGPGGWRLACSRSHGDEAALQTWLAGRPVAAHVRAGSSLKFGLVAQGLADVYPRLGRTMEWDTAAGHAVLRAAGGEVCDLHGAPLRYGKPGFENPHFVAWGQPPAAAATPAPRMARMPSTRRAAATATAEPTGDSAGAMRVLKKYPNRRLYDTQTSSYITLADVKQMVLEGADFEVRDAKTGEELTRSILLQIILEEESGGVPMFTAQTLAQIIRFYGHAMQGAMGTMLEHNMAAFTEMQKQFVASSAKFTPEVWTQFLRAQPNPMQSLMDTYAEQSRQVFEKMQQAGTLFPGMAGFPPAKK